MVGIDRGLKTFAVLADDSGGALERIESPRPLREALPSTTMSLWTIATTAATVFKILRDGAKDTLRPLFRELKGILISDRATALTFWAMAYRQICWAHLLRKFVSYWSATVRPEPSVTSCSPTPASCSSTGATIATAR